MSFLCHIGISEFHIGTPFLGHIGISEFGVGTPFLGHIGISEFGVGTPFLVHIGISEFGVGSQNLRRYDQINVTIRNPASNATREYIMIDPKTTLFTIR